MRTQVGVALQHCRGGGVGEPPLWKGTPEEGGEGWGVMAEGDELMDYGQNWRKCHVLLFVLF